MIRQWWFLALAGGAAMPASSCDHWPAARVAHEEKRWRNVNWRAWLDWVERASATFEEIPIRVTVRRDPKDDPVVMAAVAARARFIVTYDPDLLDLKKPYGIACVTPREFLSSLRR